ncbi:hypothetical protein [Nocardia stercoris]|uniref:Uncharacterized protein n=1 Tax=Nocardia stercoris TaxID=2483361 RepID=A0A3M2LBH9_9NOCA|nr:hypothetical protein [Nocardia stercoris]RMI34877.1 hypothetical protein EBN03_00415 [Nocardia stercoris]
MRAGRGKTAAVVITAVVSAAAGAVSAHADPTGMTVAPGFENSAMGVGCGYPVTVQASGDMPVYFWDIDRGTFEPPVSVPSGGVATSRFRPLTFGTHRLVAAQTGSDGTSMQVFAQVGGVRLGIDTGSGCVVM